MNTDDVPHAARAMTAPVLVVLRESEAGECRVAATPETVKRYLQFGVRVIVEQGAGLGASIADADYVQAGAVVAERAVAVAKADIILTVSGPALNGLVGVRSGAVLIGNLDSRSNPARIDAYSSLGLQCLAMELLPRITRAQAMDTLSSQSNLSGYKAVLLGANAFGRALPMMTTAAGTIHAARVFVMGAGVAGLQAIATARRLGAQVSATDVRPAAREQIQSLGAKPIFLEAPLGSGSEIAGGYAGELTQEDRIAQAALVSAHLEKQDIVITTALVAGLNAPKLISDAQIARMKPGSVIVDLAIERGGNVEGSVADECVVRHGVKVLAPRHLISEIAADASALFARNLFNFVAAYWSSKRGCLALPDGDEIVDAIRVTLAGPGADTATSTANAEMVNA